LCLNFVAKRGYIINNKAKLNKKKINKKISKHGVAFSSRSMRHFREKIWQNQKIAIFLFLLATL
jgi:hypothetical protein